MVTTVLGFLFGLAQGVRHAFEPDHLAAVSTLVAEERTPRATTAYAAAWGAGHALVLLLVGGALFLLHARMPASVASACELGVAVMLVVLGVRALRKAAELGKVGVPTPHAHGGGWHVHAGHADHVHVRRWTLARRPFLVGCIHGLAGSGALTVLVAGLLPSPLAGLVYMAIYGGGAMLGMAILAGAVGIPLARVGRSGRGTSLVMGVTGGVSILFGLVWAWPIVATLLAH